MSKTILDFQVTDNKSLNKEIFVLEMKSGQSLPQILPGQFAQIRINGSSNTFLRRPFSFHDVNYETNTVKLLIQIAGNSSRIISQLMPGEILNLVFPLGNSFSVPAEGERTLLVGGGCGVAPLLYLAKFLKARGAAFDVLMGFRDRERIIEYTDYSSLTSVYITTEDGSEGEKGFVTHHSLLVKERYDRIYCCGPDPMMKAMAKYAREKNILCEVSIENLMACGIGVCLCCVVDTTEGNVCTCTEGPVFNTKRLKW